MADSPTTMPIAIIGMSCRFSGGVTNPSELWGMVAEGRDGYSKIPASRFNHEAFYHQDGQRQGTTHIQGGYFLDEDISLFDAAFFNYSAEVAHAMDPQIRLELESVYEALENAGLPMEKIAGSSTSVFAGSFFRDYADSLMRDPDILPRYYITGNGAAMGSNRVSHFFDLRGPSMTVDTGCSTTLTALHMACQSLRTGESGMSVVTGSNIALNPDIFETLSSIGFSSPAGKCFAFDERASGYGRGEGVATVILKPLSDAIRDGDPVQAIIRHTALNQDGRTPTLTSPSSEAQEELVRSCYRAAGLDPADTPYAEAHGTGTPTGDPLEARALSRALAKYRPVSDPLLVGSVKTNIGHTETASGLASIIKTAMALQRGAIPRSLNFERPNPKIPLKEWNIKIPTSLTPWPTGACKRASINNFGYGGANSHVILEAASPKLNSRPCPSTNQASVNGTGTGSLNGHRGINSSTNGPRNDHIEAGINSHTKAHSTSNDDAADRHINGNTQHRKHAPLAAGQEQCRGPKVFILSAKEESMAKRMASKLSVYLEKTSERCNEEELLADLAYTLGSRRSRFPWTLTCAAANKQGLQHALDEGKFTVGRAAQSSRLGFIFTGQGAQWYAMGRELITAYPVFRASLARANECLRGFGATWSVFDELMRDSETTRINTSMLSLPICTVLQLALVDLLRSWGITASAVTSHSSGEAASAYAAGAISFDACLSIVYHRGGLTTASQQKRDTVRGGMLAVGLGRIEAQEYIEGLTRGKVVVACVNSPRSVTMSGDLDAILELEGVLKSKQIFARRLKVETAFHSHHMKPLAAEYEEALEKTLEQVGGFGSVRYSSPVSGKVVADASQVSQPAHWVKNMLQPVLFSSSLANMCSLPYDAKEPGATRQCVDTLVEIGPHSALAGPVRQILASEELKHVQVSYASCLSRGQDAVQTMQELAATLLRQGYPVDLDAVNFPERSQDHIPAVLADLPTYPWNHSQSYWIEPRINKVRRHRRNGAQGLLGFCTSAPGDAIQTWRSVVRLSEVPWLRDHGIQSDTVFPAAGYISMAIEAIAQIHSDSMTMQGKKWYHLRDIDVLRALVLPEDIAGVELLTSLRPCRGKSLLGPNFREFTITAIAAQDAAEELCCTGFVSLEVAPVQPTAKGLSAEPPKASRTSLSRTIKARELYQLLSARGLQYGPSFQNIESLVTYPNECHGILCVPNIKLGMPLQQEHEYVVHPATLDTAIHSAYGSLFHDIGSRPVNTMVPRSISSLSVASDLPNGAGGKFQLSSEVLHHDAEGFEASVRLVDHTLSEGVEPLVMAGLFCQSLGQAATVTKDTDAAPNLRMVWEADVDLLPSGGFQSGVASASSDVPMTQLLRLVAHKLPNARILVLGTATDNVIQSILEAFGASKALGNQVVQRPRFGRLTCTRPSAAELERLTSKFRPWAEWIEFIEYDPLQSASSTSSTLNSFDLVVHRLDTHTSGAIQDVINKLQTFVIPDGKLLLEGVSGKERSNKCNLAVISAGYQIHQVANNTTQAVLAIPELSKSDTNYPPITILYDKPPCSAWLAALTGMLEAATGNNVQTAHWQAANVNGRLCIALMEIDKPILSSLSEVNFGSLKNLVHEAAGVVWLTRGGAIDCSDPFASLSTGFLRTMRTEYANKRFISLDVDPLGETQWTRHVSDAITRVVRHSYRSVSTAQESEYAQRNGTLLIPRFIPHEREAIEDQGLSKDPLPFLSNDFDVQLQVKPGSAEFTSTLSNELLPAGHVEIEPRAFGLDRDGQVNSSEFSGVVVRCGSGVSAEDFREGMHVCAILTGPWLNRVCVHKNEIWRVPDTVPFEVAAFFPITYGTAHMAVHETADLQPGETILVHSAAEPMGQVAVMLAQAVGARIYMTVASQRERDWVHEAYGVDKEHIMLNNSTSFASQITTLTEKRGVDVVISGLGGELLQASFDCLAPFGRFIEAGKRDVVRRGLLEMSSFQRHASFSTVNMVLLAQHKPAITARVFAGVVRAMQSGQVKPLELPQLSISELEGALQATKSESSPRQSVVLVSKDDKVNISRSRWMAKVGADSTYLIVGGLSGLGKSICTYLFARGARHFILLTRSQATLSKGKEFIEELEAEGCGVAALRCDVADFDELKAALDGCRQRLPPIKGVVHGAMALRDTIFERMTFDDYGTAIGPKVHGTWNLHRLFDDDSLDFFILLSSIVGVVGNISQANYGAGGSFQDAVARHRSARSQCGVSLDLGMVDDVGYAAETDGIISRLKRKGFYALQEEDVLRLVDSAIHQPKRDISNCQVITGLRASMTHEEKEEALWTFDNRFAGVWHVLDTDDASVATGETARSLTARLKTAASVEEARHILVEAVIHKLSDMFSVPEENIKEGDSLARYGVDSLVAVDLRNWLVSKTGTDISVFNIVQSSSIGALASLVLDKFSKG